MMRANPRTKVSGVSLKNHYWSAHLDGTELRCVSLKDVETHETALNRTRSLSSVSHLDLREGYPALGTHSGALPHGQAPPNSVKVLTGTKNSTIFGTIMKYSEGIEPVTTLKTRSAELIRRARDTGQPIVITQNGKATAVLQDVESFERQRKALLLLRYLAQGEEEVRIGKGVSQPRALRHFEKKLKALRRG